MTNMQISTNHFLSVIIPIYGTEDYIQRCANSLFQQELNNIQFIFVNDCTPDRSMEVLSKVIKDYRHEIDRRAWEIVIVKNSQNIGLAGSRKHGIDVADGDYIIHCDSDDWVDENMYRLMYEKAVGDNADIVVCDIRMTDGVQDIKVLKGCANTKRDIFIERMMLQKDHWSLCNKLVRRECYNGIQYPKGGMGEDMVLSLQLIWNSKNVAYVKNTSYKYFQNPNSIIHSYSIESTLEKYFQLSENSRIVYNFYMQKEGGKKFQRCLEWLEYRSADVLMPYITRRKVLELWRDHFEGIHLSYFFNNKISVIRKIRHFLIYVGIYPSIVRLYLKRK